MFQIKKVSDEGTREPFIARLMVGILELRDRALNSFFRGADLERHRTEFDARYDPVFTALQTVRSAAREVESLVSEHSAKIASGAIVEFQPNAVSFKENIDRPLHESTARLLVNGVIALKHLQAVTEMFGINVGGFFKKPSNFDKAMGEVKADHPALEQYLRIARNVWTETFIQQRANLEHEGWTLASVVYEERGPRKYKVRQPEVCGSPVSEFAVLSARRLFAFVENIIVYTFKTTLPHPLTIFEISASLRDPHFPRRFQVNLRNPDKAEWLLLYSDADFLSI